MYSPGYPKSSSKHPARILTFEIATFVFTSVKTELCEAPKIFWGCAEKVLYHMPTECIFPPLSQLFSHIAIKSASCRNSTEVVWGAHNVQPTQMTVLGKKNPRAALSCSLPLCLQPSSTVPHAPWGSSTGRRHGTCPRTQRSPGTEPPEVSRSSTRQHAACHSPAMPTAFWGPGPWQCLPVGLAPLHKGTSARGLEYEQEISTSQTLILDRLFGTGSSHSLLSWRFDTIRLL